MRAGFSENDMNTGALTLTAPSPTTRAISCRKLHKRNYNVKNDRLQLLLNLTNRITSNLELREVLRAISANIREVMQCDAVGILLPDAEGNLMVHALEAPQIKGFLKEGWVISPAESRPNKASSA